MIVDYPKITNIKFLVQTNFLTILIDSHQTAVVLVLKRGLVVGGLLEAQFEGVGEHSSSDMPFKPHNNSKMDAT